MRGPQSPGHSLLKICVRRPTKLLGSLWLRLIFRVLQGGQFPSCVTPINLGCSEGPSRKDSFKAVSPDWFVQSHINRSWHRVQSRHSPSIPVFLAGTGETDVCGVNYAFRSLWILTYPSRAKTEFNPRRARWLLYSFRIYAHVALAT